LDGIDVLIKRDILYTIKQTAPLINSQIQPPALLVALRPSAKSIICFLIQLIIPFIQTYVLCSRHLQLLLPDKIENENELQRNIRKTIKDNNIFDTSNNYIYLEESASIDTISNSLQAFEKLGIITRKKDDNNGLSILVQLHDDYKQLQKLQFFTSKLEKYALLFENCHNLQRVLKDAPNNTDQLVFWL